MHNRFIFRLKPLKKFRFHLTVLHMDSFFNDFGIFTLRKDIKIGDELIVVCKVSYIFINVL